MGVPQAVLERSGTRAAVEVRSEDGWQLLLLILAGWINRHQQAAMLIIFVEVMLNIFALQFYG